MADISKIILPNGDQHTIKDATARSGLSNKVDKVSGKGLSTNDFTDAMESKLTGIAAGAEVNVQSDWNETNTASDAYIKNKPTIPTDTDTWKVYYGTCTTAAGTRTKTVTVSADQSFSLRVGVIVGVKFSHTNTYSNVTSSPITLNVNSTGAKNIWYNTTHSGAGNTGTSTNAYGYAGRTAYYMYDGTYWVWVSHGVDNNSTYTAASAAPLMDGTAAVGSSAKYAREDHVHPHDSTKVDKVDGKGLSTNDFTDALESKLNGIAAGAEVNVQSDWNVTDTSSDAYIKNKPTIPSKTSQLTNDSNFAVDSSYVHTDNNFTTTLKDKLDGIAEGAEVNVQSDWNVTDTDSDAFIKNKPTIPTVPSAATVKPVVDGTAAVGTSAKYAREDHVHPTDTSRAPKSHASTATTYGLGNASNYGHVKLSDTYTSKLSSGAAANGVGASQNALYNAYSSLSTEITNIGEKLKWINLGEWTSGTKVIDRNQINFGMFTVQWPNDEYTDFIIAYSRTTYTKLYSYFYSTSYYGCVGITFTPGPGQYETLSLNTSWTKHQYGSTVKNGWDAIKNITIWAILPLDA